MTQQLEFKAVNGTYNIDEMQGIVECFVAAVGNKDSVGDIVLPGAFSASLKRRKPRVVWGHDWNQPIGKVLEIYEVSSSDPRLPSKMRAAGVGGLFARVQFNLKSERGREAFNSVVFFGEDQEWSIGYKTLDSIYSQERQANMLKELELYEVSPVLHGANQLTGTISIKSEKQDRLTSFRESKWKVFDPSFAEMIRTKHPDIWALGGNIKGNDQYRALKPIHDRGGTAKSQAEINALELREAWVARHREDFLPAGVVAQIKWLAVGSRGEDYMKGVIRKEIAKREQRQKSAKETRSETKGPANKNEITLALVKRFGGLVRVTKLKDSEVFFDHSPSTADANEGSWNKMKANYEFVDGEYKIGPAMEDKPPMPSPQIPVEGQGMQVPAGTDPTVPASGAQQKGAYPGYGYDSGPYGEGDGEGDDSITIPGEMPYSRRAALALSKRMGAPVRLRSLDKNMIIADVMGDDGRVATYRLSYHFEDGKFMFGDTESVEPTLVYMPSEDETEDKDDFMFDSSDDEEMMPSYGVSYESDFENDSQDSLDDDEERFGGMAPLTIRRMAGARIASGGCNCGCGGKDASEEAIESKALPSLSGRPTDPLVQQLNVLLSDLVSFYLRAKGFAWNVQGADFAQYHEMFSEIADDAYESLDPFAEYVRKYGEFPVHGLSDFSEMRTLADATELGGPQALAAMLLEANALLLATLNETFTMADSMGEQGLADLLASRIDAHQKWRWFLSSSVKAIDAGMRPVMPMMGLNPLATKLSELLGDMLTFYFQAHGYHWNVQGQDFFQYHDMFSNIYSDVYGAINDTAENVRKLGALAPYRLADYIRLRSMPDVTAEPRPTPMARALFAANNALLTSLSQSFEVAQKQNEQGVANFLAERIDMHEKWRWFLSSSMKNGEGSKSIGDSVEVKAGRVISANNMAKLRQAMSMIQEVLTSGGEDMMQMKQIGVPAVANEIKSIIEPIIDYYNLDLKVNDYSIEVADYDMIPTAAKSALSEALDYEVGDDAYIIIDATPEDLMDIKSAIDAMFPGDDLNVIIDEYGGEWIAVQAKSHQFVEQIARQVSMGRIQAKGLTMGHLASDCGCEEEPESEQL